MLDPGFIVLHGNRLETLRDVVIGWCRAHPLPPCDDEVVLVQSNGIALWLKIALARPVDEGGLGIAAGVSVELPARFLWRMYRRVLGDAVRERSPLAEERLIWRLLRLLPGLLAEPVMAPVAQYVADDDDGRKAHALARRIADLFDGYQVYRADWLADWQAGRDVLRDDLRRPGAPLPVPDGQCWQPALWRAVCADLERAGDDAASAHRGALHRRFVDRLAAGPVAGLPPRIVVFGISSLPQQALEALAALAGHAQVLLAVLNPCRHYWADIIDARELLRAPRRRQRDKPGWPSAWRAEDLHAHAHPLLAAWGRQGRDFIRLLDAWDDPERYRHRFEQSGRRIDLFEAPAATHLLAQLQRRVLDLEPLPGEPVVLASADDSLQFHVCHGAQREVEVLHDQLLAMFDAAAAAGRPLDPRDVIVMVPDIEAYAPIVEAVFGGFASDDRRHIPFTIADRSARRSDPVIVAAEFLLALPESRLPVSAVLDLLDVPAVAERFGIDSAGVVLLRRWIEGAGIRWGLDAGHRDDLGFATVGEQNSWRFGLRRMLLGYVAGDLLADDPVAPYAEVAGLEAHLVGAFAELVEAVADALERLRPARPPAQWRQQLLALFERFLAPVDEAGLRSLQRLRQALADWAEACADAGFTAPVSIAVVREAVLDGLDRVRIGQRFLGGAVSFATLMPMRAIPFRVVAMLGMNDGDYPRQAADNEFDLMAQAGSARPGDRSRRDDDRYLFLEALLSARDCLYIGWCGRSARDDSVRPPSVLVGQLRDHLAAGWRPADADAERGGEALLAQLTRWHPLQPFSRRYFAAGHDDTTYVGEWAAVWRPPAAVAEPPLPVEPQRLDAGRLGRFLRHPVRAFYQQRLGVHFLPPDEGSIDHEPFALDGLARHRLASEVIGGALQREQDPAQAVTAIVDRCRRAGELPLAVLGDDARQTLIDVGAEVVGRLRALRADPAWRRGRSLTIDGFLIETGDLRLQPDGDAALALRWSPTALLDDRRLRHDALLPVWAEHLLANCDGPVRTRVVAPGGDVMLPALETGDAQARLAQLVTAWRRGQAAPLPLARRSAFAWLERADAPDRARSAAATVYDGAMGRIGEGRDPYLARAFADFAALEAAGFATELALYTPVIELAEVCA